MRKAFPSADPSAKWGTATPQYMVGGLWEHPNRASHGEGYDERTVPLRIQKCMPDVRLIAILRDPTARARSHHRMATMNRIEERTFQRAVDELLQSDALEDARREPRETTGYIAWGEYGRILEGYFSVFAREQILVLYSDELERDPQQLLERTFAFLGVRADFTPENIGARYRVGGTERRISWLGTGSWLNPWSIQKAVTARTTVRSLWHALPEPTRRHIDRVFARGAYRLDLWNRRTKTETVDSDDATLKRLRAHYAQDARQLAALLGSDPPWLL